jgi:hypothetical protein
MNQNSYRNELGLSTAPRTQRPTSGQESRLDLVSTRAFHELHSSSADEQSYSAREKMVALQSEENKQKETQIILAYNEGIVKSALEGNFDKVDKLKHCMEISKRSFNTATSDRVPVILISDDEEKDTKPDVENLHQPPPRVEAASISRVQADDIALLESTESKSEEQLRTHNRNANKTGLEINVVKTVQMRLNLPRGFYPATSADGYTLNVDDNHFVTEWKTSNTSAHTLAQQKKSSATASD